MIQRITYTVLAVCFAHMVSAQQELKRANAYFGKAYYMDAIPLYESALPQNKSSSLVQNLADCYYNTFDMKNAARWYKYLISNYGSKIQGDYHFKWSQSLKAIGEYEKASEVLTDYYTAQGNTQKLEQLQKENSYLENIRALGNRFDIMNLAINTPTAEFGAVQIDSHIVFSAALKKKEGTAKRYRWNNQHYLDLYSQPLSTIDKGDTSSTDFSKTVNSKMHEGTFAMTQDRKTLYFTRNNFLNGKRKTDGDKISRLKIYRADLVDGEWQNIIELPFNSDDFSTEHPALSPDGTKLYFASDRPGGQGSFDLYEVAIQSDGLYGAPINLGPTINTDKKEQFPFLDTNGNLYFASNGHPGFGLLDVFIATNENGIFQKPDNLGLPVNSGYDDFSWSLNRDGKTGYFASNRPEGKGSDDIYSFSETKPLIIEDCKQFIAGTITNRTTKEPITNVQVRLLDATGNELETRVTKEDAKFKFKLECNTGYRIEAHKESYEGNSKIFQTNKERDTVIDGSMDLYSFEERAKQEAIVLKQKEEEAKRRAKALEEKRRKEEIAAKEKRVLEERQAMENKEKERQRRIAGAIEREEAIVKEQQRTVIKTEEIHFDYSLWYLRRESRERLGKVIKIMKANPGIVLEIGTHTDIRGNARYNKKLSQKRAESARDFLIKNGIDEKRVIAKGYGESQPIVECATEEACSEEDHEWNRRCEFVIVKWE
ncbi:OmpA family protein [Flavobacteriaceae bacterium TP-CH-4]|uniref:OmpA family protein n=1 Tax=Pelagihabitans pacificus TaxID=2696054 RepID=A0A967ARQ5_9FLAO|nr:OmpA family protein [Pelagihabitans pacificus]NHF58265.1 OmpA family protein [Pelagihabitans pacificus]